ncbi:MAG TPA: DinB family protein [Planctomycetota bacterium]|nr:DinB family protein [Planctomycetota bacterium]
MIQIQPGPVVPQRYIEAVGGRDPIEMSSKAPKRLRHLIEGLSTKELEWQPAPGKWSIKQILAHLADGEVVSGARMRFVAAMDRPTITGYDQDAFVANLGVDSLSAEEWLDAFRTMRALNIALLSRLPKQAFAKVGMHTERGEESLGHMVFIYAGHDLIHERQIADLLLAYKADRKARHAAEQRQRDSKEIAKAELKASKKQAKGKKSKVS